MKQTPAHAVVNQELLAMIPPTARRVVEVGCMHGALANAWRPTHPHAHYVGIDIDADYAAVAADYCNEAFAADIETLAAERFDHLFPSDCWIFGDCLEHLRDPWAVLKRVRAAIDADGCLLTCIPNAQHWSVLWRLASGNFRYEDNGLMDRTHLRWFTRTTMLEMFAATGWRVVEGVSRNLNSPHQPQALEAVRAYALASGLDADMAVRDATPYQLVFKVVPA
jgi:trans-aconitate methyltransferase